MSDTSTAAIVAATAAMVGTIFTGVMAYMIARLKKVTESTHVLVNSAMTIQLRLNATVTKRLATVTGDPGDAAVADLAERMLKEHESKQPKKNP